MDFLSLPVEIGSKIFDYLDTKTKINVYNSCSELREYLASWCHPKRVVLSRSTLATVKTLEEELFYDLGEHILELDLSGVPDLTVDNLKPHIQRFVNLKSLDVTFTNIYLAHISQICPKSLKSIGINFFKCCSNNKYDESKEVFKERKFEAIHFVIKELSLSASPLNFLKDVSTVNDLKLTICDNYKEFLSISNDHSDASAGNRIEINFNKLTLVARDCVVTHKFSKQLDGVTRLNFKQIEYIFMMYLEKIEIYVSPLLAKLFSVNCSELKVEVSSYLPLNFMLDGNIVFKAWNKETTNFDDEFYKHLLLELKDYFPTYYCMHSNHNMKITESPSSWFCIDKCENFEKIQNIPDKITLTDFCRRGGIVIRCRLPIGLSKSSKALQHLTFLRISNIPTRSMFFHLLFEQCPKLVTLDVYTEDACMLETYTRSLSQAIHLATLKNFMLTAKDIHYEVIFGILSKCPSLENVHICEYDREMNDEDFDQRTVLAFIESCANLYSLFIEADMSAEGLTMMMSPMRVAAQTLERDYLSIEVCQSNWGWNPFADVFNPSPLHIFD